ncbi:hypothetical protein HZA45_02340 [Candidatus Peregrinibacteria bacterium]|nr:hypothetical protein [Candidatus Peregrinibacteria bacterium]
MEGTDDDAQNSLLTIVMKQTWLRRPNQIANAYLLLLGVSLFVWPVVMGIPSMRARLLWIVLAAGCSIISAALVAYATDGLKLRFAPPSQSLVITSLVIGAALLIANIGIPPLTFSDELTISLPGMTAVAKLSHLLGWPVLILITLLSLFLSERVSRYNTLGIFLLLSIVAVTVALKAGSTGLALRYPPLVHLMQIGSAIITGSNPVLFRFPNVLWTIGMLTVLWHFTPRWTVFARVAAACAVILGPLGWTYHMVLYQACGELTIALTAIFLTHAIIEKKEASYESAFLGMTFALWILYRPTCLPVFVAVLALLCVTKRWRSALWIAAIALPVIIAWMALSPLYTVQYNLTSSSYALGNNSHTSVVEAIATAAKALPENFHPWILLMFAAVTILALLKGTPSQRLLLGIAWIVALASSVPQQILAGSTFYGVARLNILILLPFGLALGCIAMRAAWWSRIATEAAVILLIALTPIRFLDYVQLLRSHSPDIYRTPPEGYDALPVSDAAALLVPKYKDTIVILAPQYEFLDWLMVQGLISAADKRGILDRSNAWTTTSRARPVLVQAPVTTTYGPNLSEADEARLRAAREWALKQKDHRIVKLGIEETVVVP